jgi:hypothetical protein
MKRALVRFLSTFGIVVLLMSPNFNSSAARTEQGTSDIVPLPPPKTDDSNRPNNQNTPKSRKKSDSCYVEVDPPRGCRYPEQHPIGEVCYCKDDNGIHEGVFLAN